MFVKICGIRTPEAARVCAEMGADAVGVVFAERSVRFLEPERAAELRDELPGGIEFVGVFQDADTEQVLETARIAQLTTVQLHGAVEAGALERYEREGLRVIRALSADEYAAGDEAGDGERELTASARLLLDGPDPGSGAAADPRSLLARRPARPWLLAGGLTVGNVGERIRAYRPDGVDVSSGVESSRGVKDHDLIRAFVAAARGE